MEGHFIVVGMGRVGYRVVDLLLRLGETVTVITDDSREEWLQSVSERGVMPIHGDARSGGRLLEAGLRTAKALIATTNHDLVNVEIALDAKNLRPDLPIVVRLFDQALARELEAGFDIRRVFGTSALAAPTFAAAALGEHVVGAFNLHDAMYVVGRIVVGAGNALAGLTLADAAARHGLCVLTREPPLGECNFAPASKTRLEAGDRLTVVTRKQSWDSLGEPASTRQLHVSRRFISVRRWFRDQLNVASLPGFVAQIWKNASTPLRSVFLILLVLIGISVVVFRFGMDLSLVDALYFVMTTVTTVGYGDISPRAAHDWLKLYACLLMLLGSAFVATLYSILTDYLVTARFQQLLGRQRVPQAGHVVVVGLGNVGFRVVEELRRAGARVVGVDRDANRDFVESLKHQIPVIVGDARAAATLARASIATASAVVAVTGDDTVNLSVVLAAERTSGQARTVCRLFDADFARKVQSSLKVDAAMGASRIAAPAFVAAGLRDGVLAAFELDAALFTLLERKVGPEWQGRAPGDLDPVLDGQVLMRRAPSVGYKLHYDDQPLQHDEHVLVVLRRPMA